MRRVPALIGFFATALILIILAGQSPAPAAGSASSSPRPAIDPARPAIVLIELQDDPTIVVWDRARSRSGPAAASLAAQAQGQALIAAQAAIEPEIAAAGGVVLYTLQRTLNGVVARVPADQVALLAALPGVLSVRPIASHSPANAQGVPLIGAPQLWAGLTGLAVKGENIKVGIIDSGIDYLHTDFGGSGLAADYARNDTTVITDNVGFPSVKVAGGYDFAGDDYDGGASGDPAKSTPRPDPDPMDCALGRGRSAGHGTHVAGSAGGYGVNADGTTYAGPWDATSVPTTTMKIGPGSAPLAKLYALRVFGCSGSTSLVPKAIEWSVDPNGDFDFSDRLDVINLSLGGTYGGPGVDPDSVAVNRAALAGVIVVASAGNSGDTFFVNGSPGTADWAIEVAASNAGDTTLPDLLRVNRPADLARQYTAVPARFGTPITGTFAITADLGVARPITACTALSDPAALAGKIALVERGACSFEEQAVRVEQAGAVGLIVYQQHPELDPEPMMPDPAGSSVAIPLVMIGREDGDRLREAIAVGPVNVTIDATLLQTGASLRDTLGDFTSRGPRRGVVTLKPDISAPGVEIFSAASGRGAEGTSMSGTSMAAPHLAGAMALLRQLHPDWSVQELKALVMNTAGVQTRTARGAPYSPSRQGAGRATLPAAATAQAVAYDGDRPGAVSLSFGSLQVVSETMLTRRLRVVNKGSGTLSYSLGVTDVVTSGGVTLTPLSSTVTLGPGETVTVPVRLTVDPAGLTRRLGSATPPPSPGRPASTWSSRRVMSH